MIFKRLTIPSTGQCVVEEGHLPRGLAGNEVRIRNIISLLGEKRDLTSFTAASGQTPAHPLGACVGHIVEGTQEWPQGTRVLHYSPLADFWDVSTARLVRVPDGISNERASTLFAATNALLGLKQVSPRVGEHVLVVGMGLAGNLSAQLHAQSGAGRVACADFAPGRLLKAKDCGLIEIYDLGQKALSDWTSSFGSRGVELVVVTEAPTNLLDDVFDVVGRGSIVSLQTPIESGLSVVATQFLYEKGIALIGSCGWAEDRTDCSPEKELLFEWMRWEKIKIDPLITQHFHFTEATKAYEGLRDRPNEFIAVNLYYE